jgi:hypothetical protein
VQLRALEDLVDSLPGEPKLAADLRHRHATALELDDLGIAFSNVRDHLGNVHACWASIDVHQASLNSWGSTPSAWASLARVVHVVILPNSTRAIVTKLTAAGLAMAGYVSPAARRFSLRKGKPTPRTAETSLGVNVLGGDGECGMGQRWGIL